MSDNGPKFEVPKNIEKYLYMLSQFYKSSNNNLLQEIIVNANTRVHEEWSYDRWDGGIFGHAIYLIIPEIVFLKIFDNKDVIQNQIKEDINKIINIPNEFIDVVFIEVEIKDDHDWRKESGLQLSTIRSVPSESVKRIWGEEEYKLFISHKSESKKIASDLKDNLKIFGISCFVAHEDIEPTKKWQDEIENALFSMDAFLALMTDGFHNSNWTDQEVGVAFARSIPIIALRQGMDPYGFIGKFQALSCEIKSAPIEIVKILIKYQNMKNAFINAVHECTSFEHGNILSRILPFIDNLSDYQANLLIEAFNENSQVRSSFGFNGEKSFVFGDGLVPHLTRWTKKNYSISARTIRERL